MSSASTAQQQQPARNRPKWTLDFASRQVQARGGDQGSQPPGYSTSVALHAEAVRQVDPHLRMKQAWEISLGPIKNIPMNLLMMYMSGNTISIFPIMMVFMMAVRPLKTLFSVSATFKTLDSKTEDNESNVGQKLVYVLGNLANVALAMYKCHSMGLLPTHASDWLAFADPVERAEWAYVMW